MITPLKYLSENVHILFIMILVSVELSFLVQIMIFFIFSMMNDFLLYYTLDIFVIMIGDS